MLNLLLFLIKGYREICGNQDKTIMYDKTIFITADKIKIVNIKDGNDFIFITR